MTVLDVNVLLYSYNADAPQHRATAAWLTELLESGEVIGLPWITIWAFVRISTNARIWPNPLPAAEAFAVMRGWMAEPDVVVVQPGARHAEILERLVVGRGAAGAGVTDAVLAALAIENGAVLASTDQDFRRFPELRWVNPLDAGARG